MTGLDQSARRRVPDATAPPSSAPGMPSLDLVAVPTTRQARWPRLYQSLLLASDATAAALATQAATRARSDPLPELVVGAGSLTYSRLSMIAVPLWVALIALAGGYRWRRLQSAASEAVRIVNASIWMLAVVAVASLAWRLEISRSYVAIGLATGAALSIAGRVLARLALRVFRRAGRCQQRVLLVGQRSSVDDLSRHLESHRGDGYRVVARLVSAPAVMDRPSTTIEEIDAVIDAIERANASLVLVAGPNAFPPGGARLLIARLALAGAAGGRGPTGRVEVVFAPEVTELSAPGAVVRTVSDLLLLEIPARSGPGYNAGKRALDLAGAIVFGILFAPLLVAIAMLIRSTSKGPALFRQTRVGRNGTTFQMVKFRSMVSDAEERLHRDGMYEEFVANDFKLPPELDPRITKVGRFLRKTSLDELPQLWNVLKGEMSLVGPRPVFVEQLPSYAHRDAAYLALRPGLTGYWQVNGRSNVAFPERAELDEYYFENRSLKLDLVILARTALRVFSGDGAH